MKTHITIRTKAKSQKRQSISDASVFNFGLNPKFKIIMPDDVRLKMRGKSPPGKSRSPGSGYDLNRIGKVVVFKNRATRNKTEFYQSKYQYQIFITI